MRVNINDVIMYMENTTETEEYSLNAMTSEIVPNEDTDNWGDWIQIPTKREIDDYGNMESFIETVSSSEAKTWLRNAIHGRGAFRMFRATLERFGLQQDWYDYRERIYRATAIEWCEYYGIEYESDIPYVDDEVEEIKPVKQLQPVTFRLTNINKNNVVGILFMAEDCAKQCNEIQMIDQEELEDKLIQKMKGGTIITAVSEQGKFVGYSIVAEGNNRILEEMYVRPDYRRKGIGTMLLKAAEEGGSIDMEVSPGNEIFLRFLNRNGYNFLKTLRVGKSSENNREDYVLNDVHHFIGD